MFRAKTEFRLTFRLRFGRNLYRVLSTICTPQPKLVQVSADTIYVYSWYNFCKQFSKYSYCSLQVVSSFPQSRFSKGDWCVHLYGGTEIRPSAETQTMFRLKTGKKFRFRPIPKYWYFRLTRGKIFLYVPRLRCLVSYQDIMTGNIYKI